MAVDCSFHLAMGDSGISISPWAPTPDTPGTYSRRMEFVKPVNLPGCPTTRGVQSQRWTNYSLSSPTPTTPAAPTPPSSSDTLPPPPPLVCVVLQSDTALADVPYASYFTVRNVCLLTVTEGAVEADLSMELTWHKSCMLQ